MIKPHVISIMAAGVLSCVETGSALSSVPICVNTSVRQNRQWMTVTTPEIPLRWDWQAGCVVATLEIAGMNSHFVTNFNTETASFLWRPFAESAPDDEDIFDLRVTFLGNDEVVLGALTSRVVITKGAFREATVIGCETDPLWGRVKENTLIPYDAAWLPESEVSAQTPQLTISKDGGATHFYTFQDTGGYHGWKLRNSLYGYGVFSLSLTFPETEVSWQAIVERIMDGAVISIR
ncbi:MAG: hypothetical protein PHV28_15600 [Kiritimatiellae bacterium]|nr:hypothetical protein [Kiritimatiellia bacterium]